ncbi:MAG TPA: asparagine synthase (glutamine-hydrolyzing) [Chitinophagaceae bacterium]|jgi:asparagine synthase (glutamine-hydrolysing)|nr:asparagine synthase (glutamine-hydrolyzing) [Chitinophagaceae bacterium]HMU58498.1 asparagine synthase (glutamine-hydrolyzing) [Chitinophagaceae bacterium]
MCGIAGSIHQALNIPRLTKDLLHRGPDKQATFEENNVVLHHHRLSILDLAGGGQPMHYEHLTIIFNGEIYNHQEVRRQYNLQCITNSDTETILHAYAKLGAGCLQDFDGMFALAIYDRKNNELFLARDRAGKKPLFYYADGKRFVFASELNALRGQLDLDADEAAIFQYLYSGYLFNNNSPYKQVKKIPAGSYAVVKLESPDPVITKWWDIHPFYRQQSSHSFEEALQHTDTLLHTAIRRRVESSDLEVGSFLSGGIDSGLVTAIAREYNSSIKTFTVSFEGEYDEAPLAKLVAEKYGTVHHEIKIGFDHLLDDVEQIIANYGLPFFDSSAIPSYYVSQAAKKHLTVILNGDGGDEIFAGYRRYVPFAKYDFFKPKSVVRTLAKTVFPLLPVSNDKKSKYNYIYRLADLARKKGLDTYLSSTLDIFEDFENMLKGDRNAALENIRKHFDRVAASPLTGMQKMLNLDFDHILEANLLVKMDIATMAHSLEGRSPLLSKDVLEYVPTLPDSYKVKGAQTKYLLRRLAEKYLPAELIHQPKRGFEIPLKKWLDGELKDLVASYILSADSYSHQFVEPGFIQQLWDRKVKTGDEKRAKMLWTLFALDVWYKRCYLGKGS